MSSLVPPNASAAFRSLLIATSTFRTYLGGDFVYTPELPPGISGATKRVVFRFDGGSSEPDIPMRRLRVNFRCYDSSEQLAEKLYMQLYGRLHWLYPKAVLVGSEYVGFYRLKEDVPIAHIEDPTTGWKYAFAVWGLTVSTMAVTAA
jgi:hypothetical protein